VTSEATRSTDASEDGALSEHDVHLFREGTHCRLYGKLGAHPVRTGGVEGTRFALWAPNAASVRVMGEFNQWNREAHHLARRQDGSGIWEGFVPGVGRGASYKYHVVPPREGPGVDKCDPFAFLADPPPGTAARAWTLDYEWGDGEWMTRRRNANAPDAPISVYEVHLGSWRRVPEEGDRFLGYREAAPLLADHARSLGFTHVELLPLAEHPFYGSWGYQATGYFAPTARYGTPQDLMYLIDHLHRHGLGVILDWVPSHFPGDAHGLASFDGAPLFEYADPKKGFNPAWNSYVFDYGRNEVRSFLLSSAHFWLDRYHVDGLRVDGVAAMLYLDYARKEGEWTPNRDGGRENLEAVDFLRSLNETVHRDYPDVQTIAEESTAWPKVSRPVSAGGLGFEMKWNMGWMHDTLQYLSHDPPSRKHHHNALTFSICYAFDENFLLPLSHDEVGSGKPSLLGRMPGDAWQQLANLRLLYGYMWGHPGKKLLFMGGEFGQLRGWDHDHSLDWHLAQQPAHGGVRAWLGDLNRCYRTEPALHEADFAPDGFEWVDCDDAESGTIGFLRRGRRGGDIVLVVCNFTSLPRPNHRMGVPRAGYWQEILNSDAPCYGGGGVGNFGGIEAAPVAAHGRFHSLSINVPPLAAVFFKSTARRA